MTWIMYFAIFLTAITLAILKLLGKKDEKLLRIIDRSEMMGSHCLLACIDFIMRHTFVYSRLSCITFSCVFCWCIFYIPSCKNKTATLILLVLTVFKLCTGCHQIYGNPSFSKFWIWWRIYIQNHRWNTLNCRWIDTSQERKDFCSS